MEWKLRLLVWVMNRTKQLEIEKLSPTAARKRLLSESNKASFLIDYQPIALPKIEDHFIKTRDDFDLLVRAYHPSEQTDLPLIVFYHGGGFVVNSVETHDSICRRLAHDNQAIVLSVDYRLAPEFPYPTPVYDCYDAFLWVAKNAQQLGGNPNQLFVMGDSAGGNLATVVSLKARDEKAAPIAGQVLIYPCTNATLKSPSIEKYAKGYLLTKSLMRWFTKHYVPDPTTHKHPYVSPIFATDLSNLPPAFIITAEYDPLIEEGKLYADLLEKAGNQVQYKEYKGLTHSFFGMPKVSKKVLECHREVKNFITDVLEQKKVVASSKII